MPTAAPAPTPGRPMSIPASGLSSSGSGFILFGALVALLGAFVAVVMRAELQEAGIQVLRAWPGEPKALYNALIDVHGVTLTLFAMPAILYGGLGRVFLPEAMGVERLAFGWIGPLALVVLALGFVLSLAALVVSPDAAAVLAIGPWRDAGPVGGLFVLRALSECLAAAAFVLLGVQTWATFLTRGAKRAPIPPIGWAMLAAPMLVLILAATEIYAEVDHARGDLFDALSAPHMTQTPLMLCIVSALGVVCASIAASAERDFAVAPLAGVVIVGVGAIMTVAPLVANASASSAAIHAIEGGGLGLAVPAALLPIGGLSIVTMSGPGGSRDGRPGAFVAAFAVLAVFGGVLGEILLNAGIDEAILDTYFVVAYQHFVWQAGLVFVALAGWFAAEPRLLGRRTPTVLAMLQLGCLFAGAVLAFAPMIVLGMQGMPRRYVDYPQMFEAANAVSSFGAYVAALAVPLFVLGLLLSRRAAPAAQPA